MEIFTSTCSDCGTVVAANELEESRRMKCPGIGCENVLAFEDLPDDEREYFLDNKKQYLL